MDVLISKLLDPNKPVILSSLVTLRQIMEMCSDDVNRIYSSEIWPSLADLFDNVCHTKMILFVVYR